MRNHMKISVSYKLIKGKGQKSIQRKRTEGFQWYLDNTRFATGIFVIYLFYFYVLFSRKNC